MPNRHNRKTVLIVGAKRIGMTVARRLAQAKCSIAIAYRNSPVTPADFQSITTHGDAKSSFSTTQADISNEHEVKELIAETVRFLGGLDAVINLASDYPRAPFDALDADRWDRAMAAAKGSYLLGVHAARAMVGNPGPVRGHIIYFGDWAAEQTPYTDYLPYLTAKAAIHFMTRGLAAEVAHVGIRVNCIAPGPTMRPPEISQRAWDAAIDAKSPLRQESSADDIANMIETLLASSSITGEIIRIDSGRHIRGV